MGTSIQCHPPGWTERAVAFAELAKTITEREPLDDCHPLPALLVSDASGVSRRSAARHSAPRRTCSCRSRRRRSHRQNCSASALRSPSSRRRSGPGSGSSPSDTGRSSARTASATVVTASSCPTTHLCGSSARCRGCVRSFCEDRATAIPVRWLTTSSISSGVTRILSVCASAVAPRAP